MDSNKKQKLNQLRQELVGIESKRKQILKGIAQLEADLIGIPPNDVQITLINNSSPTAEKIKLFRNLFRGREDVYPEQESAAIRFRWFKLRDNWSLIKPLHK